MPQPTHLDASKLGAFLDANDRLPTMQEAQGTYEQGRKRPVAFVVSMDADDDDDAPVSDTPPASASSA